jgi:hypothetical protein
VIQQAQPATLLARTPKEKLQLILGEYYKQLEDFKSVFGAEVEDKDTRELFSLGKLLGEELRQDREYINSSPDNKLRTYMRKLKARQEVKSAVDGLNNTQRIDLGRLISTGKLVKNLREGSVNVPETKG